MIIMSRLFEQYGEFCATHPYEVIFAVVTLTASFLTIERSQTPVISSNNDFNAINIVCMTIIRCCAILYSYHQFRNLQKLGSKYILGIAGLFVVFASFVFTSTVLNLLQIEYAQLKDALFFFLLLIDLSKAASLAQFALTATSKEEISKKIARGMSVLGPPVTLDTVVEALVIGVGTLSGVDRLEIASYFACLSVIVNYIIFMTVYPACLSLMLELVRITNYYGENHPGIKKLLLDEHEKSNPAVQRVKIIMSMGLMVVHIYSRWSIDNEHRSGQIYVDNGTGCADDSSYYGLFVKQLQISLDHIVILTLLTTLMVKFIFFESKDNTCIREQIKKDTLEELQRKITSHRVRTISSNVEVQTDNLYQVQRFEDSDAPTADVCRKLKDCLQIYRSEEGADQLSDNEIILLVDTKHIPAYDLEKALRNPERGVKIRRKIVQNQLKTNALENLPYREYDYSKVMGVCCENVVGYVPMPLGVAGPLYLDGKMFYIPMATTEGCLVASTNRGCRAVEKCGIKSRIVKDGMTRGPVVRFPSVTKASEAMTWLNDPENYALIKQSFDSTSRFARLLKISIHIAGRYLFIRFVAETGDAMGMNMLSKGTEQALKRLHREFPEMEILSLSGNICTDKKPSAINWVEGRGKTVVCEAIIPAEVVLSVLKTNTHSLVDLNISKNMIGSAIAGSIGGFNAHAANIVTAIFIATGQDPAQNVASSNCITIMEPWAENGQDLYISCTMPSLEIGTVGGGTVLPAQAACLDMLGVRGPHETEHGENAKQLARVICGAVLAGELSLMAALASGHLVKSHLRYNRSYSEKDSVSSGSCDT